MSKNAAVRIKRRFVSCEIKLISIRRVARSVETKPAKKVLFPTSPNKVQVQTTSNKVSFTSSGREREVTNLTGLRPTVSMVGYTAAFSCFCCFAGISNMYKH